MVLLPQVCYETPVALPPSRPVTMEVSCKQCGAKYQFDSSAIPAGGYDAQCSSCGTVFFVAPEAPAEELVSASCSHCGVVYQFPASAVPPTGYDAECTQCHNVFFVSPRGGAAAVAAAPVVAPAPTVAPTPPVAPAAPVAATDEPHPLGPPKTAVSAPALAAPAPLEPEPTPLGPPKTPVAPLAAVAADSGGAPAVVAAPAAVAPTVPDRESDGDEGGRDMMALSAELGEPASGPAGVSIEEDFEQILQRKRRRWRVVGIIVALLVAYVAITYLAVPRVFDLTVGRFVGIKLTVHPDAVPLVGEAATLLLDDTDAAYGQALAKARAALDLDPRYGDAVAVYGLASVFRGEDVRERGRVFQRRAATAIAEIKRLEELPAAAKPADFAAQAAELRQLAKENNERSGTLYEEGSKIVRDGFVRMREAIERGDESPWLLEAAGIYYSLDPDSVPRATQLLRQAQSRRLGTDKPLDLAHPPNGWLPMLQGMVLAADRNKGEEARAAFHAAIVKEPRLARARWELVRLLDRQGAATEAHKAATELLGQVAGHDKAKEYLAAAAAAAAPEGPPPDPGGADDAESKAKKRKGKKRR
jgi:predicted Zn finger-like uncharacterized protein